MTDQQKLIRKIAIAAAVAVVGIPILLLIIHNGLMNTIAFLLFFVGVPALMVGGFMLMKRVVPPDPLPSDRNVRRGARVISAQAMQEYLTTKQQQWLKETGKPEPRPRLSIAGVQLPTDLENLGIFTMGSPGSGKTQAIAQLLSEMRQRRDFRVVVFDRNAEFLEKFYQPNDLIFNPADARSVAWSHSGKMPDLRRLLLPWFQKGQETTPFSMMLPDHCSQTCMSVVIQMLKSGKSLQISAWRI